MRVDIMERDLGASELARINDGFAEYSAEHGVPFRAQKRLGFVATDGERFVGTATGLTDHDWFRLTDMWIERPYRRQGTGRDLLARLEERVRREGLTRIYTWTAEYEAPIFYRKLGYEVFGVLEGFYATGHDRIGLRKVLTVSSR